MLYKPKHRCKDYKNRGQSHFRLAHPKPRRYTTHVNLADLHIDTLLTATPRPASRKGLPHAGDARLMNVTQHCPCDGCHYQKLCARSGDTCPRFRHWLPSGNADPKFEAVPDQSATGQQRTESEEQRQKREQRSAYYRNYRRQQKAKQRANT